MASKFKLYDHVEVPSGHRGKVVCITYLMKRKEYRYEVDFTSTCPYPYADRKFKFWESQLIKGKYKSNWEIWKQAFKKLLKTIFG